MNKQQEKVLIATLCGLVITAAGALAVQPVIAAGQLVDRPAHIMVMTGVHWSDARPGGLLLTPQSVVAAPRSEARSAL